MSARKAGIEGVRSVNANPVQVIAVTGGKGGVGKTTLAANVAIELARGGAATLLVDLDLGLANVDVLLGLSPERSVEDALAGRCELGDCVVAGPAGLSVLPAASGAAELARLDGGRRARFVDALDRLSRGYGFVIGDSGAGIGPDVLAFAALAEVVLVVTTPDPAALTDAYGLIKALEATSTEAELDLPTPELVLNQVTGVAEAEDLAAKLAAVCRRFLARAPRLAGWMPRSSRIAEACRHQAPFALRKGRNGVRSLEQDQLARLAKRIAGLCRPAECASAAPQGSGGP
jgi:flagellar biosynthesis protein FlhG